ncbi:MAG: hypothetical protein MUC36_03435 [Planctomycetes bacterium]|jgi:hypothetical protein|nr:hypothetical protein [Planctomycetota bacterium]
MRIALPVSLLLASANLTAQVGAVPGTDIRIFDVGSPTIYGRRGLAYPNGEIAMAVGHSMCNTGTVHLPWVGWVGGGSGSVMLDTYPKIAFLIARESGGRMVQISNKGHLKHSRVAFNFNGGPCGGCQSGPSQTFRIGCYDVYSTGFNGNQFNLGPTAEIDPWLGSWNPVGSYFDRGDPAVVGAAATDGIQSLTSAGFDAFKNRLLVREQELAVPGAKFFGQAHVVAKGEPGNVRGNNFASRQLGITWGGSSWSPTLGLAPAVQGSVLQQWTGASVTTASNGSDDGHFVIGVKVTGPVNGLWHYEYAVHNQDNTRGAAALRIPVCATARVQNLGFRDLDTDSLNDWTSSRNGGELSLLATVDNPLDWNTIYNVWFDSDAAPQPGNLVIDAARIGPGSLQMSVPTTVPGLLGTEYLGVGCGNGAPSLFANGAPVSPNPGYALQALVSANGFAVFAFAGQTANVPLGGGCTLFVDDTQLLALHLVQADAGGAASWPMPIPAGLAPTDLAAQAFELVSGGPVLGLLAASNGLRIRGAASGCP